MFGRMGLFHSKVSPKNKPDTQLNILDPRSPTVNINRSPIGLECAQDIPSITKMRDLTTDLTEILDNVQTPDRVMGEKLQSIFDPRSPSLFVRTPLILDETNASTVSLKGVSLEYEEISCEEELSFGEKSLSFKECEDIPIITITAPDEEASSLFSDISLNTELKTEIDSIIQKLYDAGKDPRSPSTQIHRTPIVFEETDTHSEENEDNKPDVQKEKREDNSNTQQTNIYQEETRVTVETPKKEKMLNNKSSGNATQRTPLGCVTNVKTPVNGASELRKTALLGQMKQNAATLGGSAELAHGRRSLPRSKIPTLRMK
ncbi:uncharacterized protein LOC131436673 isoform X1 [Malaya genurostris]|uniref:uncharacterized protein LOC131436673 isoform X1 n=1 Tax=Malaya genurostris TaxID=325434 RepID=UPI0026F39FDE|nr:uncharacterized protein LOC131436673 isoform X1 [Malaya genurostris]